jgi:membrane protein required for colicin V production
MSALDIALTVILSYFFIRGIFRGLVKEIVGILGLFVAFWVAGVYWTAGAEQLKPVIDNEAYRSVLSFLVIYLIIYFLIGLLSLFVDKIVKVTITPLCSGLTGGALGLLKGAALSVILLTASTAFIRADMPFYTESVVWRGVSPFCEQVKTWIPESLRKLMGQRGPVAGGDLRVMRPAPSTPAPATGAAPAPVGPPSAVATPLTPPTDYESLAALVEAHPDRVNPAWLERVRSASPAEVDAEFLTQFIRDNRVLFVSPRAEPEPSPAWPSPARE